MIKNFKTFIIILLMNLSVVLCDNSFSFLKGMAWSSLIADHNLTEIQWGYIPNVSNELMVHNNHKIDFELSLKYNYSIFNRGSYNWDFFSDQNQKHQSLDPYRFWIRYSNDHFEGRLGLQKISFGPSQIYRPLNWFGSPNYRDPTGQTDGVEALRLRYFPNQSIGIWAWITSEQNSQPKYFSSQNNSYGGRLEYSNHYGDLGITTDIKSFNNNFYSKGSRFGLDYRYDGYIGFWLESAWSLVENSSQTGNTSSQSRNLVVSVGNDYTVPIGPGIYLLTESLYLDQSNNNYIPVEYQIQKNTSFMMQIPLGIFQQIMFVSNINWNSNKTTNYFRWSSTFDQFIINFIVSNQPQIQSNQLQVMIIYNH